MTTEKTVGDIESFVSLLCVACEDKSIYETPEKILSLPDQQRKVVVMGLIKDMRIKGAPTDFVAAFECLVANAVAEKAYEVIFRCQSPR